MNSGYSAGMIPRKKRTQILITGNPLTAKTLADEIRLKHVVNGIEEPNEGLVMIRMQESAKHSIFNLGEVLVTESRVRIGDSIGIGIVVGHKTELAYDLAVIDAACAAGLPETAGWDSVLLAEEKEIDRALKNRAAAVLQTRVNFETIDNALGAGA